MMIGKAATAARLDAELPGLRRRSRVKPPLAGARVLVVDDVRLNRELMLLFLQMFGCEATLAEDGAQAVERMAHEPFDMVLMDLHMPVLDGWGAASAIRLLNADIPIIALTASDAAQVKGLDQAGFDGHLEKPLRLEQLGDELAVWFEG